jgi:hypothetical protein
MTEFTRRTVVTGAAATTAATAVGPIGTLPAHAADPTPMEDFLALSDALTGISKDKLGPGIDPIDIKQAYFDRAQQEQPAFDRMLQILRNNRQAPDLADIILNESGADIRYLARSIMLAWYLGAWYDPDVLQTYDSPKPPDAAIPFRIVSPAAYTQGWTWRVAQAHPMGYSDLTFGYWSKAPPPLNLFTGRSA